MTQQLENWHAAQASGVIAVVTVIIAGIITLISVTVTLAIITCQTAILRLTCLAVC